jgi:23S rRNA pseudouridine1911/1915/1917 synthase
VQVIPVHRLDRDTSGLMIFALTFAAESALTQLFKTHAIERKYLAVVHGHPAAQTIETFFVRDRGDGLRGSSPRGKDDPAAQHAVTHVRPLERIGDYSVVECRLETGRTHQIRIHLAEIGHPLCGEKTYRHSASVPHPPQDRSGAPRQALHSHELSFTHPLTARALHFKSQFPPDLAEWIERVRRAASK